MLTWCLWGGFKFRRQHPVGPFFVDFFCDEFLLAVEVDGTSHVGREEADLRRQHWLESQHIQVIRFSHTDILQDLRGVLERILRACQDYER